MAELPDRSVSERAAAADPTRGVLPGILRRPVTVGMATLAAVVFGIVSFSKLPLELLPDISYPTLTVQTELPDAAPQEVEQLVTRPVEQVVGVVQGLRRFHSSSRAGVSEVVLEFSWDTDMSRASLDVREKLDLVELPDDARSPVVYRFDPSLDPMLRLALEGPRSTQELRRLAETVVEQRLETLEGVAAARVVGGAEEEVRVALEDDRLAALGLPFGEVVRRIGEENVNRSGGELRDQDTAYRLRTVNEYETLDQIAETVVRSSDGGVIRVRDVGRVFAATDEREVRVRVDGRPAVQLFVYKEGDANAVQVARGVRARLESLEGEKALAGCELSILFDQASYIEESIENVESSALFGAILASAVLYFFLCDWLATVIIALSIPISVAVTFLLMRVFGISLNVMSLGGLALGVGMLVDNSVVVLESVSRLRERGWPLREAVVTGTRQVLGGVTSSTLTTVSVFLPLIFVEGMAGQFFRDQALTVTFSLLASLFVAVTLIPVVLSNRREPGGAARWVGGVLHSALSPVTWLFQRGLALFAAAYDRALRAALSAPWAAPLAAGLLFLAVVPRAADLTPSWSPTSSRGSSTTTSSSRRGHPSRRPTRRSRRWKPRSRARRHPSRSPSPRGTPPSAPRRFSARSARGSGATTSPASTSGWRRGPDRRRRRGRSRRSTAPSRGSRSARCASATRPSSPSARRSRSRSTTTTSTACAPPRSRSRRGSGTSPGSSTWRMECRRGARRSTSCSTR